MPLPGRSRDTDNPGDTSPPRRDDRKIWSAGKHFCGSFENPHDITTLLKGPLGASIKYRLVKEYLNNNNNKYLAQKGNKNQSVYV